MATSLPAPAAAAVDPGQPHPRDEVIARPAGSGPGTWAAPGVLSGRWPAHALSGPVTYRHFRAPDEAARRRKDAVSRATEVTRADPARPGAVVRLWCPAAARAGVTR